jgi:glycerophosphoryl diester phosphodiesterase
MAAFRHALTLPIDALELDVQMSRDGYALVFHDETVERLTEGRGNLLDLDLAELRSLNVAAHFPGGWPEIQRMPTLTEVLALARQEKIHLYIELKASKRNGVYGRYAGIAEAVARDVRAAHMQSSVLIMAFDWALLPQIKTLLPEVQTAALVSEDLWNPHEPEALTKLATRARALQCEWINLDNDLFTPEMPAFFHEQALRVGIWTVNEETRLQYLARSGVDSITTDRPDLFRALTE